MTMGGARIGRHLPAKTHIECLFCGRQEICGAVGYYKKCNNPNCNARLRKKGKIFYRVLRHEHRYNRNMGMLRLCCPTCQRITWQTTLDTCSREHAPERLITAPSNLNRGTRITVYKARCSVEGCGFRCIAESVGDLSPSPTDCPTHFCPLQYDYHLTILASGAVY